MHAQLLGTPQIFDRIIEEQCVFGRDTSVVKYVLEGCYAGLP